MAAWMPTYAPHRHKLPLIRSLISSSENSTGPADTSFVTALGNPFRNSANRRADLHWRAVSALKPILFHEFDLKWMQLSCVAQTFYCVDLQAVILNLHRMAGDNARPVTHHRARNAGTLIA